MTIHIFTTFNHQPSFLGIGVMTTIILAGQTNQREIIQKQLKSYSSCAVFFSLFDLV